MADNEDKILEYAAFLDDFYVFFPKQSCMYYIVLALSTILLVASITLYTYNFNNALFTFIFAFSLLFLILCVCITVSKRHTFDGAFVLDNMGKLYAIFPTDNNKNIFKTIEKLTTSDIIYLREKSTSSSYYTNEMMMQKIALINFFKKNQDLETQTCGIEEVSDIEEINIDKLYSTITAVSSTEDGKIQYVLPNKKWKNFIQWVNENLEDAKSL